jgi:hypothetical protein
MSVLCVAFSWCRYHTQVGCCFPPHVSPGLTKDAAVGRVVEFPTDSHVAKAHRVQLHPAPLGSTPITVTRFEGVAEHVASSKASASGAPGSDGRGGAGSGAAAAGAGSGAAGVGSGAAGAAGAGSGAGDQEAPVNVDRDNAFRWAVWVEGAAMGAKVTIRFVAGLKRTLETFLRVCDGLEGDVRRTNRAWRRRLAQQQQQQQGVVSKP